MMWEGGKGGGMGSGGVRDDCVLFYSVDAWLAKMVVWVFLTRALESQGRFAGLSLRTESRLRGLVKSFLWKCFGILKLAVLFDGNYMVGSIRLCIFDISRVRSRKEDLARSTDHSALRRKALCLRPYSRTNRDVGIDYKGSR